MMFRRVILMFRKVVYCSGGLYAVHVAYIIYSSGGLHGCYMLKKIMMFLVTTNVVPIFKRSKVIVRSTGPKLGQNLYQNIKG